MTSVNINIGANTPFALSETRVQKLMSGDTEGAKAMGLLDRFKDLFNHGAKQAALNELVGKFEASVGSDAVSRFRLLSDHLVNKSDVQLLDVGVDIRDHQGKAEVTFLVKGQPIKTLNLDHASVMAQLGVVVPSGPHANLPVHTQADWMANLKLGDQDASVGVTNESFSAGGVHKKVAIVGGKVSGLLRAEDSTGRTDFANEVRIQAHANDGRPELARYISTQRSLETVPEGLKSDGSYAVFDTFRPPVIQGELDKVLGELTPDQARSALAQTVDMLRVFYKSNVSHRDLHMHNLMVYRDEVDPSRLTMKAIDFGKSKVGEGVSQKHGLDDLRYMFNQTAIGAGDTVRRGYREAALHNPTIGYALPAAAGVLAAPILVAAAPVIVPAGLMAPELGSKVVKKVTDAVTVDTGAVPKHYPLHRLMAQISAGPTIGAEATSEARSQALGARAVESAQFKELLANVGNQLIKDLEYAENPDDLHFVHPDTLIDRAFQRAAATLDNAAVSLSAPAAPSGLSAHRLLV